MNILLLLPALFTLLTNVVGPVLTEHKTSVITQILGGAFDGSANSLVDIIENVMGKVTDEKRMELTAQIQTLLAQAQINQEDAKSEHFIQYGARPFLFWGLSCALLMSVLVEPTINYIVEFFGVVPPAAFVLSPIVLGLLSGLCGVYITARSFDKRIK